MKKVLILCDDYYPSSRATIAITQRFAEGLVKNGYDVSVMTIREYVRNKPDYPETFNGVTIYDYTDFGHCIGYSEQMRIAKSDKKNNKILKLIQREKKLKFSGDIDSETFKFRWNIRMDTIRQNHRKNIYNKRVHINKVYYKTCIAKYLVIHHQFDEIISVSLPFSAHHIAHEIKKELPDLKWSAVAFDPYAFDEIYEHRILRHRLKEEQQVYADADNILFLSQFEADYLNNPLRNKITYFDLPNIRPLLYDERFPSVTYDSNKISCVFLGNLFLIQRHPKFLFELIEKLSDDIVVYLIGGLIDIPKSYIDEWVERLNGKLVYCGRVGQEVAINSMLKADVLLNIGHHTNNQCPSKVIEYVCTGKPIWNISKIPNCTSLPYLQKYPRQLTLYEYEEIDDYRIKELERFLRTEKEKSDIPFDEVEKLFPECTMNKMIEAFET